MPAVLPNIYTNINIAENDTVIVTGGMQNGTTLSKVLALKVAKTGHRITTRELEELPLALKYHCSTVYRGQLFVLGGYTDEGFPRNQNYGLINGREWHSAPKMIYARFGLLRFSHDSRVNWHSQVSSLTFLIDLKIPLPKTQGGHVNHYQGHLISSNFKRNVLEHG